MNKSSSPAAVVVFSGGQDSTTCLVQALHHYGAHQVEAIAFSYGQRHAVELEQARWIAQDLGVPLTELDLSLIGSITHNALTDKTTAIATAANGLPNTFVDGRNALFLLYAAIFAKARGIRHITPACVKPIFQATPTAAMCLSNP